MGRKKLPEKKKRYPVGVIRLSQEELELVKRAMFVMDEKKLSKFVRKVVVNYSKRKAR